METVTNFDDISVGPVSLKREQGSSLVYAVGTARNDSDRRRFGVKIQLDLLDEDGNRIGGASDYIAILEPRKEWQFRALLMDGKAAKVRAAGIEEQK